VLIPDHAIAYVSLCLILHCTPLDLITNDIKDVCDRRHVKTSYACALCGMNPFSFLKELSGERRPLVLHNLNKLYSVKNSFSPWIDTNSILAAMLTELKNIEVAIAS